MKFVTDYYRLPNQVRVLLAPMPGIESVTAMVMARTGSRNETVEQAGISHVLEHMLFKGTKSFPTPMSIAERIDGVGAMNNAFTGKEYTGYYVTSAAKHLPMSLQILGEMVTVPRLAATDLSREREVIVEEINMYEDQPMEKVGEEWENLIYRGSALGREIIGTKETVRATESTHLRQYMEQWYRGGNMLVVIAGKIVPEAKQVIETAFGGMAAGELMPYVSPLSYGPVQDAKVVKATEQAHFYMGVPAVSMRDPRRFPLQLAQVILGGGMSSRLFNEIREKRGLAYYVKADLDTSYDGGYLAVRAGVKISQLAEALRVVRTELEQLADNVSDAELAKAKEYVLGHLPLSLEETMGVAHFLGTRTLITDEIRQPEEVEIAIKSVSLQQVKDVWRELVKPELIRSVVLGPQ